MTQQQNLVADTPVNIVSALSLSAGEHLIQPIGGSIRLAERTNAEVGTGAHVIEAGVDWLVVVESLPIWIWSSGPVSVIVSEA